MAVYTTRLKLRRPAKGAGGNPNDPVNVLADVDANMDIIDADLNCFPCSSANRPSAPYQGQLIYETDTTDIYLWTGSAWAWVSGDNSPRGTIIYQASQADSAEVTGVAELANGYCPCTFVARADRRYWFEAYFYMVLNAADAAPGNCGVRLRWAAGASVTSAGTQIGTDKFAHHLQPTGTIQQNYKFWEQPPNIFPNGQVTVGLFFTSQAATKRLKFRGSVGRTNRLVVRDMGL